MSLLSIEEIAALVPSALSIADLQIVLNREEAELVRRCGPHGDGVAAVTETFELSGSDIYLSRPAVSVSSVAVVAYIGAAPSTLAPSQYYLVPVYGHLRISPFLTGSAFVTVTYVPKDDRALRRMVLIELVRIALEQTAYKSETLTGTGGAANSYTAPDWFSARETQYGRLVGMQAI